MVVSTPLEVLISGDVGLEAEDYVQCLYEIFNLSVKAWPSTGPEPRQWKATYAAYAELRLELGSVALSAAWAASRAGDPDWTELAVFGRERDTRRKKSPSRQAYLRDYRRSPKVKEKERLRARDRRRAAREAREAARS